MDSRSIRHFEAVARTGSLRKASEILNVASSAISRTIALLEDEFGVELFERVARGMTLTEAGRIYARYCRAALLDVDRVRAELDDLKGMRRAHIRLASIEGIMEDFVPRTLVAFRQRFPGITLSLRVAGAEVIAAAIAAREVDVGIAANTRPAGGLELAGRIFDPLLAIMAPSYKVASGKTTTLASLIRDHPVAVPDRTFAIRRLIDASCEMHRIALDPVLEANSLSALRGFARSGGGITFLPGSALEADLRQGTIVARALNDRILRSASIDILLPADRAVPAPMRELARHVSSAAERLVRECKAIVRRPPGSARRPRSRARGG